MSTTRFDRRIIIFLVIAAAAFGLTFVVEYDKKKPLVDKMPWIVCFAYLFLALIYTLQWLSRRSDDGRR